jgi:hypothetical protein
MVRTVEVRIVVIVVAVVVVVVFVVVVLVVAVDEKGKTLIGMVLVVEEK